MKNPEFIVRKATIEDIEAYSELSTRPSIKAVVLEVDGKVIGIGGLCLSKGRWYAFVDLDDEARVYKTTIARTAIRFLRQARADGIKFIYAGRDHEEPRSGVWLESLGFEIDPRTQILYRWRA